MLAKFLLASVFVCIGAVTCRAEVIFSNSITGTNPNTANPFTSGQVVVVNLTVSGIGRGSGITGTNANNRYNASSFNTATLDLNAYFNFTLEANAGFEVDFENFVYTGQVSDASLNSFAFRSSVDGFASDLGAPTATGVTIDLSGSPFQNRTGPTEFRLYGWGASASGNTFSVNDFSFRGTVTAVPEPASVLLLGVASASGLTFRRFRRKSATV